MTLRKGRQPVACSFPLRAGHTERICSEHVPLPAPPSPSPFSPLAAGSGFLGLAQGAMRVAVPVLLAAAAAGLALGHNRPRKKAHRRRKEQQSRATPAHMVIRPLTTVASSCSAPLLYPHGPGGSSGPRLCGSLRQHHRLLVSASSLSLAVIAERGARR